ncbi:MAG: ABC transporter permease, partial [Chloroflexi bacterium]|nr:ABC transporter permease [Chloroflexota bacterium]
GWVDFDGGNGSAPLLELLGASDTVRPVVLDKDAAQKAAEQVRDGKLAAALTVPEGFSQALWRGQAPKVHVVVDQDRATGITARRAIDTATVRLLGAVKSARLSAEAFEVREPFPDELARLAYLNEAFLLALEQWRRPPITLVMEEATRSESNNQANPYNHTSPGMLIQFAIWGLIMSTSVMVTERKHGTMRRLLTTAIQPAEIIAGHALAIFLLTLGQALFLLAFAQVALGVNYLRQPLAVFLVTLALSLWVVSLGMLIGALAKSDSLVLMWSLLAMFLFTALGGAWFPLEMAARPFQTIGQLTPTYWAMHSYQNVLLRGMGLNSVLLPVAIVLGYAVVFFLLAVWRFRFE